VDVGAPSVHTRGMVTERPSVLFVCVKNGGKSQMAAGLMRAAAGDTVDVFSAGTRPGESLNAQSVEALLEMDVDIRDQRPQAIDPVLLASVDAVVVLGSEARVDAPVGVTVETWETDEPSERGIEGMERMRLVRDDIASRVADLRTRLGQTL
jgi:arsenate-mycothiol transferase